MACRPCPRACCHWASWVTACCRALRTAAKWAVLPVHCCCWPWHLVLVADFFLSFGELFERSPSGFPCTVEECRPKNRTRIEVTAWVMAMITMSDGDRVISYKWSECDERWCLVDDNSSCSFMEDKTARRGIVWLFPKILQRFEGRVLAGRASSNLLAARRISCNQVCLIWEISILKYCELFSKVKQGENKQCMHDPISCRTVLNVIKNLASR